MNKLLMTISVLILSAEFTAAAQDHAQASGESGTIAGTWQFFMETPHGKMAGAFWIQQEGSKLTGVCEIEGHGSNPLTGTIEGKKVALKVSVHDSQMTLTFSGSVDGPRMSGSIDPHGITWTATRHEGGDL